MTEKKLVNRVNRVIGQLEAIKRRMDLNEKESCRQNLEQLKAAINALKKFGDAYVAATIDQCFENQGKGAKKASFKEDLKDIVSTAFSF